MISDEEDDDDPARRAEAASLFAAAMSHNTQAQSALKYSSLKADTEY
jgi:hypothetical protein